MQEQLTMDAEVQSPNGAPMIHPAIIAIMRAIGPIAKDQDNKQQGFKYRGVDQVYNAVHPHFAEHGVYVTSTVLASEHRPGQSEKGKPFVHAILTMRFTYWAADGSHVSTEVVGEGIDYSGDKASNKAMSIADKYAILQLLKIPTALADQEAPLYDNPAADASAPKAAPRAERPKSDAPPPTADKARYDRINGLYHEWHKSAESNGVAFPSGPAWRGAWEAWLYTVTAKGGLGADWKAWTDADLETVEGKLGVTR